MVDQQHACDGVPWCVIRTDDLGNEQVMSRGLGQAEAQRLVQIMTDRGHKQLYHACPCDRG
jgi:hypothetical protein